MSLSNTIYVASAWGNKPQLRKLILPVLTQLGLQCSSRWIDYQPPKTFSAQEKTLANPDWIKIANYCSQMDLEDIDKAKAVLFVGDGYVENGGLGGMWAEFGYALAKGKIVIWLGDEAPNPFVVKAHYFCKAAGLRALPGHETAQWSPGDLMAVLARVYGRTIEGALKTANMSRLDAKALDGPAGG